MKANEWRKLMAGMVAVGMLASQPAVVFADNASAESSSGTSSSVSTDTAADASSSEGEETAAQTAPVKSDNSKRSHQSSAKSDGGNSGSSNTSTEKRESAESNSSDTSSAEHENGNSNASSTLSAGQDSKSSTSDTSSAEQENKSSRASGTSGSETADTGSESTSSSSISDDTKEEQENAGTSDVPADGTEKSETDGQSGETVTDDTSDAQRDQTDASKSDSAVSGTDSTGTSAGQQKASGTSKSGASVNETNSASGNTSAKKTAKGKKTQKSYSIADNYSASSNAELIARQNILDQADITTDFRFWTVAREYALAKDDLFIMEDQKDDARKIGSLEKNGLCYVLEDYGDWVFVESGKVRGFVRADQVLSGDEADLTVDLYEKKAEEAAEKEHSDSVDIESVAPMAKELISWQDNQAFAYSKATTYQTVVEKDTAVAKADLKIYEAKDAKKEVGTLKNGGLMYILADKDSTDGWVYVESGDVKGFVKKDAVDDSVESEADVNEKGHDQYVTAEQTVKPEENKALYYTITSIKSGVSVGQVRESLVRYAAQFIGNPYVWGGTSLTSGADCSGFVQQIFAQYGYKLPRTSQEQSQYGTKIKVEDAQPGDLIFYANGGRIHHVVIYAGNGKTIEAKGAKYGIVSDDVRYGSAVWAVRVLNEVASVSDIPAGLGKEHTYMGWQMITARGSQQYALRQSAGMKFDSEGFGRINGRYVIACTTTFGNVGDYVDFTQDDGTVIHTIIGDIKNPTDAGCNAYGHDEGRNIVEFVVDKTSWYNGHANPGTAACHPEWNHAIVKAENTGSYYAVK